MTINTIFVEARWDEEAFVWVASSNSIEGLSVEAATLEHLKGKVEDAVADLIELNGIASSLSEIPVCIVSSQIGTVPNPQAA
ncbi:MAG: DUF1902 domain-containing protein [Pseudomonadota bacterium]